MKKNFLKLAAITAVMFISIACVFAEENVKPVDFNSLNLETASKEDIINGFEQSVKAFYDMRDELIETMNYAYMRHDAHLYRNARIQYEELRHPFITEEQTNSIVANIKSNNNKDLALWLLRTSMFYRPAVNFVYSADNCHYEQCLSVAPGTEFELPSLNLNGKQFKGWKTEDESVSYNAGDKMTMPFDSTTLYAVFE